MRNKDYPPLALVAIGALSGIALAAGAWVYGAGNLQGRVTTQVDELGRRISLVETKIDGESLTLSQIEIHLARIDGQLSNGSPTKHADYSFPRPQ